MSSSGEHVCADGTVPIGPLRLRRDVEALSGMLAERLGDPGIAGAMERTLRGCGRGFRCRKPAVAPAWTVAPLRDLPAAWPASLRGAFQETLPAPASRTDFLTWYLWDRVPGDGGVPLGWRLYLDVRDDLPSHMPRVARALWRSYYNVYEVMATDGRERLDVVDLVFGDRLVIHDRSLAAGLQRWDLLVVRLVLDGTTGIVHSLHSVLPPAARAAVEHLVQGLGRQPGTASPRCLLSQLKREPYAFLKRCEAIFEACADPPDLTNLDGETLVDTRLYFRVVDPEHALSALLRSPFLEPVRGGAALGADEPVRGPRFVWLREGRRPGGDQSVRPILGTVVVGDRYLVVECNSRERGLAFQRGVERLLGGAARYVSTVHTDFEQHLLASAQLTGEHPWPVEAVPDDAPLSRALLQAYQQWLDTPLLPGDRGGFTPREAARSGTGRWWLARHLNRLDTVQLEAGEPGVPIFFDLDVIRRVLACCPRRGNA